MDDEVGDSTPALGQRAGRDPVLVGIELIVDDLDRSLALWTDVLGFDEVSRGASEVVVGELAIVTDGRLAITLLRPADAGDGHLLSDRAPRLTQLVLAAGSTAMDDCGHRATESGLSVVPTASGFYLAPEAVEGALGLELAIVMTGHAGGNDAGEAVDRAGDG